MVSSSRRRTKWSTPDRITQWIAKKKGVEILPSPHICPPPPPAPDGGHPSLLKCLSQRTCSLEATKSCRLKGGQQWRSDPLLFRLHTASVERFVQGRQPIDDLVGDLIREHLGQHLEVTDMDS